MAPVMSERGACAKNKQAKKEQADIGTTYLIKMVTLARSRMINTRYIPYS